MADRQGALTEVGTNELEVVEFVIERRPYVINVAKVREIIRPQPVMPVPGSHSCVLGVFRNREDVIPLVDLGKWLGSSAQPDQKQAKVIVTEFNRTRAGFLVHAVSRIHRVSWSDLESPEADSMMASRSALGFMRLRASGIDSERIVFLLDFEGIVAELHQGESAAAVTDHSDLADRRRNRVILIAEDSLLARKALVRMLETGGYEVVAATNGEEAWDRLVSGQRVDAVISDIEMPRMDGHHLTRRIKEDARFQRLPVVLYSSMIYEEMKKKGESIGADAQICKPDLAHLLKTMDNLLFLEH